jgi:methylmalonyl-CoA mutase N-terminal domain/subunit
MPPEQEKREPAIALAGLRRDFGERAALAFFASNLHEQVQAGKIQDAEAAAAALEEVRRVAGGSENLLPPMRKALRARCTIGEICGVLRDEWGMYDSQRS